MSGSSAGSPAHGAVATGGEPEAIHEVTLNGGRSLSEPLPASPPSRPALKRRFSDLTRMRLNTAVTALPPVLSRLMEMNEEQGDDVNAPSPAPTEVDDPDSQDLIEQILQKGVKIRDFAFLPPYLFPNTSSSSNLGDVSPTGSGTASTSAYPLQRTTELFDPYKGFLEVDYRWNQVERTHPITGKTLRRLLDMKWLSPEEFTARAHPMDVVALDAHDSRRAAAKEANCGVEVFPWRPLIPEATQPPTLLERRLMLDNRGGVWRQHDRMLLNQEATRQWRRREEEVGEKKRKEMEENAREREMERKKRGKRKMEEGLDIDNRKQEAEGLGNSSCSTKRLRLSPSDGEQGHMSSQGIHTHPLPPKKQYPAPLQAYNPKLYPEAASIIQASSHPRPFFPASEFTPGTSALQRTDTPPAFDRTDTPPVIEELSHAQRLVHPKQARGLGRTQTFREFY